MKIKCLILFSLMSAGVFCGAQSVDQGTFNDTLRKIQNDHRSGRVINHAKLHEAYLRYMNEAPLNNGQKCSLWSRIFSNAVADRTLFEDAKAKVKALPDANLRSQAWGTILASLAAPTAGEEMLILAQELFTDVRGELPPPSACRALCSLARQYLTKLGDVAAYEKALKEIQNYPAASDLSEKDRKILAGEKEKCVTELLGIYTSYDPEEADKFIASRGIAVSEKCRSALLGKRLDFAVKSKDRELFDKTLEKIRAMENSPEKNDLLIAAAQKIGNADMLETMLKSGTLSALEQLRVITAIRNLVKPQVYNYAGYYQAGSYEKQKEYALLGDRLITETNEAFLKAGRKGARISDYHADGFYRDVVTLAYGFGDYAFGDQMLEKALAVNRKGSLPILLEQLVRKDDVKGAIAACEEIVSMKGMPEAEKETASAMKYFLGGGTFDGFDTAFQEKKYTSAKKMNLIRRCARIFFRAKKFDRSRDLDREVLDKMFREPDTKKVYVVRYVANPPKTAGAWAKSPFYDDWSIMEQRFSAYNGYQHDEKTDIRAFLKDSPELKLKDEYRTGLHIFYNEEGVHFYLRCNDPKAEEIMEGKRPFGGLEWLFQPGSDHAYHTWYFSGLPDVTDHYVVNWAATTKHYRLTYDGVQKDAVVTPEGVVAHSFVPWLMVWDKMPSASNVWRLGLQVWGPEVRTLSGIVHELERTLRLKFDFTPEQELHIKRKVAKMAFNRYNTIRRDQGGKIQTWNDPVLGDPVFYEKVVAPFIKELDEAGERLMKPAPDSEIPELFEKYVPLWAEINIVLAEKRGDYLSGKFMETE